jgi:hypothetical protein
VLWPGLGNGDESEAGPTQMFTGGRAAMATRGSLWRDFSSPLSLRQLSANCAAICTSYWPWSPSGRVFLAFCALVGCRSRLETRVGFLATDLARLEAPSMISCVHSDRRIKTTSAVPGLVPMCLRSTNRFARVTTREGPGTVSNPTSLVKTQVLPGTLIPYSSK